MITKSNVKEIVGEGIYCFAFVWLPSKDTNTNKRRGDFLVQRTDGSDIRLHPQRNKTKIPT